MNRQAKLLERSRKKRIRVLIHDTVEENCKGCKENCSSLGWKNEVCLTKCPVGQMLQSLSIKLVGDEAKGTYVSTGEPIKKGRWTEDEELYLVNHAHLFAPMHLAVRLNRSPQTVNHKLWALRKGNVI